MEPPLCSNLFDVPREELDRTLAMLARALYEPTDSSTKETRDAAERQQLALSEFVTRQLAELANTFSTSDASVPSKEPDESTEKLVVAKKSETAAVNGQALKRKAEPLLTPSPSTSMRLPATKQARLDADTPSPRAQESDRNASKSPTPTADVKPRKPSRSIADRKSTLMKQIKMDAKNYHEPSVLEEIHCLPDLGYTKTELKSLITTCTAVAKGMRRKAVVEALEKLKKEHLHEEEQEGEQSQSDVHEGTLIDSADGEMEPEETNGDMSPTGDQPGLQAFPDFEQDNEEAAKPVSKMMGVPEWLARPTTVDQSESLPVAEAATQFQLSERCIKACGKLGIERFFAVQVAAFPILLQSRSLSDPHLVPRDICVSAPTGSGKTISYVIPVTEALAKRTVVRLRALVILPTRDLVMQVKETFDAFVRGTDLKVATATGQQSFAHEQAQLVGDPVDG
ncbi:hypothetical protein BZG36_05609, partial [Bifiguratus adelaidae]